LLRENILSSSEDCEGEVNLDKTIVEVAKALKESFERFGVCFNQVLDIILQHERRIADLEGEGGVRGELRKIQRRIEDLGDAEKRERCMIELAILAGELGVENLEA
jgi:hypothetical protein